MKKFTFILCVVFALLSLRATSQNAPISTIGSVTSQEPTASVSVTATNFTNIGSFNMKILYNSSIASVTSVTLGTGLIGGLFTANTGVSGEITISYSTYPALTLSGSPTLFTIDFTRVAVGICAIIFDPDDNSNYFYDGSWNILNDSPMSSYYFNGSLTFAGAPHTYATPFITACPGTQITVPIRVTDFKNIGSFSLKFTYNSSMLQYVSSTSSYSSLFSFFSIYGANPGILTAAGTSMATNGVTLTDNTVLYSVTFNYLGGTTALTWINSGGDGQYTGPGPFFTTLIDNPTSNYYFNGQVTSPSVPLEATITAQTNVACYGFPSGSVTVTATPGTGSPPYTYSIDGINFGSSGTFGSLYAGNYNVTVKDGNNCTLVVPVAITQPTAALQASITAQTNVICYGTATGSVTVAATAGTGTSPYTYSIDGINFGSSGTFGSLAAGNYTVTVKDANNCTTTVPVTITQPPSGLTVSITAQTNVLCYGNATGSVTVAASGGSSPYTYSKDGVNFSSNATFSSLTAGGYIITAKDASLCTATVPVTITQPAAALAATIISQTNVLCYGASTGSVTVAATAGTGTAPYTYSKDGVNFSSSGTFSALAAGNYTITVKDANQCTVTVPVTITQPGAPITPGLTGPTTVCQGSTGNQYSTETGKISYFWTVSAGGSITAGNGTAVITVTWNLAGPGTVSVNYIDGNGCTAPAATVLNVTINPLPVPTITGPSYACAGTTGNVYFTETGKNNYLWAISNGGVITSGSGLATITVTWNTAGNNTVSVNYSDNNGCTAASPTIKNVQVNPVPTPVINGPGSICGLPSTGNVYSTEAGMTNYGWSVSAGGQITAGGGPTSNSVTVTWNTDGNQTVSVYYTDANTCTGSSSKTVLIPPAITLSGNVKYFTPGNPSTTPPAPAYPVLSGVTVKLQQSGTTILETTTNTSGNYSFIGVCPGTYDMVLSSTAPTGGVNATDAGQVNYWGVYSNWSSSPLGPIEKVRLYAGDVVTNQMLNSADAGRILQYYVTSGTPAWSPRAPWTFWPRLDMVSANPPFGSTSVINDSITVPVASGPITKDFWALATGDFNRDFDPTLSMGFGENLHLEYERCKKVEYNETIDLPVITKTPVEIGALSIILEFPADKIEITNVVMNQQPNTAVAYYVSDNQLKIGWYSLEAVSLEAGEVMFTISVRIKPDWSDNEPVRFTLLTDPRNQLADVNYQSITHVNIGIEELSIKATAVAEISPLTLNLACIPNPVTDNMTFSYTLPERGMVTLGLFNILGEKIKDLLHENQSAGRQTIKTHNDLISPGVYLLKLQFEAGDKVLKQSIKMVVQ